ncbi:MAG: nucleotide-binding protein [Myxococcota bacterium]
MRRVVMFSVLVGVLSACKKEAPAMAPDAVAAVAAPMTLSGTVAETLDAPSYTYLKLTTAQGEKWAAVPKAQIAVGASVTVAQQMVMTDFESKSLGRKFDSIVFGTIAGDAATEAKVAQATAMGGSAPSQAADEAPAADEGKALEMAARHAVAAAGPTDAADVKVGKAEGADARTVEQIHLERQKLAGKPVVLRAKVVKATAGVMGRNWLHVRDGSGDAAKRTNDLTVTSADNAAVGDVVLVHGTVQIDRDFGAGYSYPVIVEDAKLTK